MGAALDREIRLQKFADVLMATGGDLKAAGAAVGIKSPAQRLKLRGEAAAKGLLAERQRRFVAQYDIEVGAQVERLLRQIAGTEPTKVIEYTNAKGKVTERETHYDRHAAVKTLLTMAGVLQIKRTMEVGPRLAELLTQAQDAAAADRLERERLTGRLPVSLETVRARAEALAPPIKQLKAALLDVKATVVPATPPDTTPS